MIAPSNYVLWSFVFGKGWFPVDRTRPPSTRNEKPIPGLDLAGLGVSRDQRLAYLNGEKMRKHLAASGRFPWMVITPSTVNLQEDWKNGD
jgi:hypothetical protein